MSLRLLLALVIFMIDVWAISRVLSGPPGRARRARWILAIIALPIVGVWWWHRRVVRHS